MIWGSAFSVLGDIASPGGQLFKIGFLGASAYIAGYFATCLGLPSLLGMMTMGIILRNIDYVVIDETALFIILTRSGLEVDPVALKRLSGIVVRIVLVPAAMEAVTIAVATYFLLNLPWIFGFLLGSVLAAISPAVIIPCILYLQSIGNYGKSKGIPTLATAFSVLLGIITSTGSISAQIIQAAVSVLIGLSSGIALGMFLRFVPHQNDEAVQENVEIMWEVFQPILFGLIGSEINLFVLHGYARMLASVVLSNTSKNKKANVPIKYETMTKHHILELKHLNKLCHRGIIFPAGIKKTLIYIPSIKVLPLSVFFRNMKGGQMKRSTLKVQPSIVCITFGVNNSLPLINRFSLDNHNSPEYSICSSLEQGIKLETITNLVAWFLISILNRNIMKYNVSICCFISLSVKTRTADPVLALMIWSIARAELGKYAAMDEQLFKIGVLGIAAYVAGFIFAFFRLPSLLGMMLMGILFRNVGYLVHNVFFLFYKFNKRKMFMFILLKSECRLMFTYFPTIFTIYLSLNFHRHVTTIRTSLIAIACLFMMLGSAAIGFEGAGPLGCFVIPIAASNAWPSKDKIFVEETFAFLWHFFQPLLFGLIGASINFTEIEAKIVRSVVCFATLYGHNLNWKEKLFLSITWCPKATIQAALGPVALDRARDLNLSEDIVEHAETLLVLAVLSVLITAPLFDFLIIFLGPRLLDKEESMIEETKSDSIITQIPTAMDFFV
ncbi:hypothetical protein C0J52_23991 [Blattella germanica]|nr:hypothetical protein C0J52_23991 [Blattella germanica]